MKIRVKCLILLFMFLVIISFITSGYSYARYASNYAWNYYLGTKGFYLSSDELGSEKVINTNSNWNFERTTFNIKNSDGDYLVTDFDIEYTAKCIIQNDAKEYSKCVLNGTDLDTISGKISSSSLCVNEINDIDVSSYSKEKCDEFGYKWHPVKHYNELYFEIVKTSEENQVNLEYVSVLIEVTSTSPYSKKLIGEFNLSSNGIIESGLKVDYKEFENYSRVVVSNYYDENKCVKLKWDSNDLLIDETELDKMSYQYDEVSNRINEINFSIDKRNSMSYLFYRIDFSESFDYKNLILIESNECTTS